MMETKTIPEAVETKTVTLIPVAMVVPTRQSIYAPSRLEQKRTISYSEFIQTYADNPRPIQVSFGPDGKSNPRTVTAYGCGMDCWWIVGE